MAQHTGNARNHTAVLQLREQPIGQQYRQHAFTDIVDAHQDTCPPTHQKGSIGSTRVTAAAVPDIDVFQFGKAQGHVGAAHQISSQNHQNITHSIHSFSVYDHYSIKAADRKELSSHIA